MWTWLRRLSNLARQSRHDEELREEIEAHRRFRQAHLQHDGVPEAEAADASRRAMGNVVLAREKPLSEGEARKGELTLVRTFGTGGPRLPPMVLKRAS